MLGNPGSGIREIFLVRFPRNINRLRNKRGQKFHTIDASVYPDLGSTSDWLVKQFASTKQRHPNLGSGTSSGFPQIARDFSKSCSKKQKPLLLLSSLIWSTAKMCKFYNKSTKFFKHFV